MSSLNNEAMGDDDVVEVESIGGPGEKLKEKTKKDNSEEQLKNKYNQLRQRWKDFSKILEETGIGFNAVTNQLSAEDTVWKKLYEKHKSARSFRKKGCKRYDKLNTIFGDTTATRASSHPSTKSPSDSEDEDDTDGELGDSEKQSEEGPKAKKAKSNKKLELLEKKLSASSTSIPMNDSNDSGHQLKEDNDDLLMECIDTLSGLEGIDGASFAKATKLIHDDPTWRKIFLRLSDDRKIDFVLNI
ncbi:hypothetical protein BVRB_6g141830 isoform B [Beta vulgaris subsp. vulgaris]|nr:hypothetical protein BVRB_6g141830 isoform B [Beta vulgaris subsp. vulgaris]